jgi:adenylate kinase
MKAVVLLGAPGSGKGTVADHLAKTLGLHPFSTGARIREEMSRPGSRTGALARPYIDRGDFIPDDLALTMVSEILSRNGRADKGWVFDGFPRTAAQAKSFDGLAGQMGGKVVGALHLQAAAATLRSRLEGRMGCPACGQIHHAVHLPPRHAGVCDSCGARLSFRPDDRGELADQRLRLYPERALGLVEFYQADGRLVDINAEQPLAAVCSEAARWSREKLS